eukprot:4398227-Amphidinium_carterae.1
MIDLEKHLQKRAIVCALLDLRYWCISLKNSVTMLAFYDFDLYIRGFLVASISLRTNCYTGDSATTNL